MDDGETIERAALREAHEEIGLDGDGLRVLGRLTPLYIPISNFALYPVLGTLSERPSLVASAYEVAHILEVALDDLLSPHSLRPGWLWRGSETITVPFFALCGERVWGAPLWSSASSCSCCSPTPPVPIPLNPACPSRDGPRDRNGETTRAPSGAAVRFPDL